MVMVGKQPWTLFMNIFLFGFATNTDQQGLPNCKWWWWGSLFQHMVFWIFWIKRIDWTVSTSLQVVMVGSFFHQSFDRLRIVDTWGKFPPTRPPPDSKMQQTLPLCRLWSWGNQALWRLWPSSWSSSTLDFRPSPCKPLYLINANMSHWFGLILYPHLHDHGAGKQQSKKHCRRPQNPIRRWETLLENVPQTVHWGGLGQSEMIRKARQGKTKRSKKGLY